jgi:hypothetical protein
MPSMTKALLLVAVILAITGCYDEPVMVSLHEPGVYKGGDVASLSSEQENEIAERFEKQGDR